MKQLIACLTLFTVLFTISSCQKETSFEGGLGAGSSEGSLKADASDDCLPKTVAGAYVAGTALNNTNYIQVDVNVTKTGSYTIFTDTVNGFYFRAAGVFLSTGVQTVKLVGNGTPATAGINNFIVQYNGTFCFVQVTTLATGGPATFTLQGAGGACLPSTVNGAYIQNTALTSANTIVVSANVTTAGTYTIATTAVNGMSFSATGAFTTTGVQTVTLNGTGTPTTSGTSTISVTAGAGSCTVDINVLPAGTGAAVYTLQGAGGSCLGSVVNGTYTQGAALSAANTVVLNVNVTTAGIYSITTTAVNGMTFSASGSFTTTGVQTVTLTGSGTPVTAGTSTVSVTAGGGTCTFDITVVATASDYYPRTVNSNWSYEIDDDPNDSLLMKVIPQTLNALSNTWNIFMITDDAALGFDTSGYYRKSGGDYFQFMNLADYGFDNDQRVEINFLKDNVAAGTTYTTATFSNTFNGNPVTFRFQYTVLQKDVPVTVNTVSYPNTIVMEQKIQQFFGGIWVDIAIVKDYYSRNIGWIFEELFDGSGVFQGKVEIRRHQVF